MGGAAKAKSASQNSRVEEIELVEVTTVLGQEEERRLVRKIDRKYVRAIQPFVLAPIVLASMLTLAIVFCLYCSSRTDSTFLTRLPCHTARSWG